MPEPSSPQVPLLHLAWSYMVWIIFGNKRSEN